MKKNIIKKLLAASIAALALFAFTGCPGSPETDTKSEPGVLETRFPHVIGKYKAINCEDTIEFSGNDTYKIYWNVQDKEESGTVEFIDFEQLESPGPIYTVFKLMPETPSVYENITKYFTAKYSGASEPEVLILYNDKGIKFEEFRKQ